MMNKLYQGDNLEIMQEMESESVDLIATDPPFNTNKNWIQFDDRWGGLNQYLDFMKPRLIECHRVLKDTGSLYLHCDPTASHYLKVMLDTVFGIKQFRNEIVWCYTGRSPHQTRHFNKKHDTILCHSKSDRWKYNIEDIRIPHTAQFNGDKSWLKDGENMADMRKRIMSKGKNPETWWADIARSACSSIEHLEYPTQKPIALYQRMIKASSNRGDVVLDPFCGSGTTLDAAQSLDRQWIGIDENPHAIQITEQRLIERHALLLDYEKHDI